MFLGNNNILEIHSIKKSFSDNEVLKGIDLVIKEGEFITLLGPSGCGKTTTLRIIAGLEMPDEGQVFLEEKDVTKLEPEKRDLHTVFQNYALFPHMNIYDNVAYSLKLKKIPKAETEKMVTDVLKLVRLEGFEKRKPNEMSGGQRQRVAIARAIVGRPKVVLLDEPLGALDLQLRRDMQKELKTIQETLGITFVYITHDQEEALNMSDRIAVMNKGKFEQIGTPEEIYEKPKTSFVANFIGQANILKGEILEAEENDAIVKIGNNSLIATKFYGKKLLVGDMASVVVRSENIYIEEKNSCERSYMPAEVIETHFAGGQLRTILKLENNEEIIATRFGNMPYIKEGANVYVGWNKEDSILTDLEVAH